MKTLIKICGLANQEAVDVAVQSGADLIGFVFAKKSPRCISPELASQLSGSIPAQVKTTAVMLHPRNIEVKEVFDRFLPDYLQSDAKDFESLNLPEGCHPLKVYRDRPQLHFNEIDPNNPAGPTFKSTPPKRVVSNKISPNAALNERAGAPITPPTKFITDS